MTTPCRRDPERWYSDVPADIEAAKAECRSCPSLEPCRRASADEQWGVWAAEDKNPAHMPASELLLLEAPTVRAPKHGERACYIGGCREPECCAANTAYVAAWRRQHEHAPVTGRGTVDVPEQLALEVAR